MCPAPDWLFWFVERFSLSHLFGVLAGCSLFVFHPCFFDCFMVFVGFFFLVQTPVRQEEFAEFPLCFDDEDIMVATGEFGTTFTINVKYFLPRVEAFDTQGIGEKSLIGEFNVPVFQVHLWKDT